MSEIIYRVKEREIAHIVKSESASDWNKEKATREVGKSYGLSEKEMDEVGR